MEIFFHIGTHKTGSTAIQGMFDRNRDFFIKKGIYYPKPMKGHHGHHNLPWSLLKNDVEGAMAFMADSVKKAEKYKCNKILISSEELEFVRNKNHISRLSEYGDPRVICFLRRPDRYLESEYNQHVKMYSTRFAHDIYHFFMFHDFTPRFNYFFMLSHWIDVFGEQNARVFSYDKLGKGDGIFKEIMSALGIIDSPPPIKKNMANESISTLATIYLSRLNSRRKISSDAHQKAIVYLNNKLPKEKGVLLPMDYREKLCKRFSGANERLLSRLDLPEDFFDDTHEKIKVYNYVKNFNREIFREMLEGI